MAVLRPTTRQRTVRPMAVGAVVVFFFVSLFAAALHQPQPHDLRLGIAAPAPVVDKVVAGLGANAPGAFAFEMYSSADEIRAAILDRDIVGGLTLGSGQPHILVASAGGQAASTVISGALGAAASASGQSAVVEDVQPLPASDSRGLVPFFLVMGVSVSAFVYQLLYGGQTGPFHLARDTVPMVVFAIINGLLAALAVQMVVGFDSGYWLLAGVCALLALAVTSATAALCGLFGAAGVGLAGLVLILLANVSSGSVIGSSFLPQPFRWLSPVLPAGAGLEASRSALYFEGAALGWRLGALALWVAGSFLVLGCLAAVRTRIKQPAGAAV